MQQCLVGQVAAQAVAWHSHTDLVGKPSLRFVLERVTLR
jgi:hypothetical protein